jgi:hypothetical protein
MFWEWGFVSVALNTCSMSRPCHLPLFDHSKNIWRRVQIVKLLTVQFSLFSYSILSLRCKYFSQYCEKPIVDWNSPHTTRRGGVRLKYMFSILSFRIFHINLLASIISIFMWDTWMEIMACMNFRSIVQYNLNLNWFWRGRRELSILNRQFLL